MRVHLYHGLLSKMTYSQQRTTTFLTVWAVEVLHILGKRSSFPSLWLKSCLFMVCCGKGLINFSFFSFLKISILCCYCSVITLCFLKRPNKKTPWSLVASTANCPVLTSLRVPHAHTSHRVWNRRVPATYCHITEQTFLALSEIDLSRAHI